MSQNQAWACSGARSTHRNKSAPSVPHPSANTRATVPSVRAHDATSGAQLASAGAVSCRNSPRRRAHFPLSAVKRGGGGASGSTGGEEAGYGDVGGGGNVDDGNGVDGGFGVRDGEDGGGGEVPPARAVPAAGAVVTSAGAPDAEGGGAGGGGGAAAATGTASPALHLRTCTASGDEPERGFWARYGCLHRGHGASFISRTVAAGTSEKRWDRARCSASGALSAAFFTRRAHSATGHAVGTLPAAYSAASTGGAAHRAT